MVELETDAVKQKFEDTVCSDCWPEGNAELRGNAEKK